MGIFNWIREQENDGYGNNIVLNGDAEEGFPYHMTYNDVVCLVGGVEGLGNYVYKLTGAAANLGQIIYASDIPFQPDMLHFYAFVWVRDTANYTPYEANIKVTVSYDDDKLTEVTLPLSFAWSGDEFYGNVHTPTILVKNFYLAECYVPIRPLTESPLYAITWEVRNDESAEFYVDNITIKLNHNAFVVRNTYSAIKVMDKNGINPDGLRFYKNMVWNSSFEIFDPITLEPIYWTGGVSDPNSNFSGSYSLKLLAAEETIQSDQGLINPTWFDGGRTRVSFNARKSGAGELKVEIYDITNGTYFELTPQDHEGNMIPGAVTNYYTFTPIDSWLGSGNSFSFDVDSHVGCVSLAIKFTNTGTGTIYIDDVMLTPDVTGKWPQLYKDGPRSTIGIVRDSGTGGEVKIVAGITEATYAALTPKDAATLYFCIAD